MTDVEMMEMKQEDMEEVNQDGGASSHESTSSSCEDHDDDKEDDDDEDDENESEAESSEFDEDININTRDEFMKTMQTIEQTFSDISKRLYAERRKLNDKKLQEVKNESSLDYINGVKLINEQQNQKLRVIELRGKFHRDMLKKMLEAEKLACAQQLQNDKQQLVEHFQNDLDEKFRRLQEDRDNIDMSVDKYSESNTTGGGYDSKGRKISSSKQSGVKSGGTGNKRKKKPVTVTGPYIVYMLKEEEIMSDLADIRKAVSMSQRRKTKSLQRRTITHACRYEDGKLIYSGRVFQRGQRVALRRNRIDPFSYGTIVGISEKEILVRQVNGVNSKVYLHQLQRGRIFLHARE